MSTITKKPLPRGFAFKVLDNILYDRFIAVRENPRLKIINRWDLSDCFYNTRKKLDAMGYDVSPLNDEKTGKRKVLYSHVKDWCDNRNIKRHEIGIFSADRTVLAFQGETYSVSFENYQALAHLGVDIVCVEKEGIVDKQVPFTTDFGIGLLQSLGFVTEYGDMLAQSA